MFGYQQTAFNYANYGSANGQQAGGFIGYGQQQNNIGVSGTPITSMGTAANAYAASQYSLAASAYAQFSQAAQQQQTIQPPPPPPDNTSSAVYGVIGAGKPSSGSKSTPASGANALTLHYAGYEAAVYAAASSYMQAKNQGQTKNWMQKSSGNKGFQKKRYGLGHQNRDMEQFFCELCKISCAGQLAYKDHLDGKPHKKKESQAKTDAAVKNRVIGFRCEVCEVTMSSKDTFDAHVKGQKHQRTVALLRRMGKPMPQLDTATLMGIGVSPTFPNEIQGQPIPTVGSSGLLKKVVGVTGTKFVGGTTLLTTGKEIKPDGIKNTTAAAKITGAIKPQDLEKALLGDENIKPIGQEFIEEEFDSSGKFMSYGCKLCDCKFSDKGAKDVHLKGRRHRLNYKQKVDPSLKVEMKSGQWGKGAKNQSSNFERPTGAGNPNFQTMLQPRPLFPMPRTQEMMDDQHIMHKLQQIELNGEELGGVERLALFVEKTLKDVSDSMVNNTTPGTDHGEPERVLKGVMRVGLLAKYLLLKSDIQFDLVVLCSKIPTISLLKEVSELFKKSAKLNNSADELTIVDKIEESAILVSLKGILISCRITFTSVIIRDGNQQQSGNETNITDDKDQNEEKPPIDALPRDPCLNALAELRHAKFYQVKCAPLHSVNITVKIVRDISQRVLTWKPLHTWAIELLIEKTLGSIAMPLSPGDAVRRLFEVISSGVFLSKRSKLLDPCEKEPVDVLGHIGDQEREDITSSAQHALRLIAFNQIYKILGIDRLPDPIRPNITGGDAPPDGKKVKREESV